MNYFIQREADLLSPLHSDQRGRRRSEEIEESGRGGDSQKTRGEREEGGMRAWPI
jgi:hypothetical protein